MQIKDKLAIGLSIAAFCISIYSTIAGELRSTEERRRTIRSQLTDVLGRLEALQLDAAKLQRDAKGDSEYLQQITGALQQEKGFFIDQAVFLADEIPNLTTSYELNTIAVANAENGNLMVAEKYYKRAIDVAPTDLYRSMAMRSYAAFLFYSPTRIDEGRELFRKAIETLKGEDNFIRGTNGFTYQMWAVHELRFAHSPEKANKYFDAAKQEYSAISADAARNAALWSLEAVRRQAAPRGAPDQLFRGAPVERAPLRVTQEGAEKAALPASGISPVRMAVDPTVAE